MPRTQRLATLSKAQRKQILVELRKRGVGVDLLSSAFTEQRRFIEDASRLKAALCTRRAGKSMAAGLYLIHEAMNRPGTTCLYIALTRESAQRILFKDVLKVINKKYGLNMKFNHASLTVTLPNDSVIYLIGADSSPDESEKVLGQKFSLVIIDEAASFRQDLESLVYKTLRPATADYQGTIALIGTPGNNVRSLFYEVTQNGRDGWAVHRWSAADNPHMQAQWADDIAEIKRQNPEVESTAWFQQMYLGRWAVDEDSRVYRFQRKVNIEYKPLPDNLDYILSVDLGFNDATAFVVAGYSKTSPYFYIAEAYKLKKIDITDAVGHIMALRERWQPKIILCDSVSIQTIVELRQRHHLPIQTPAQHKYKKMEFINLMNADFLTGRIRIWHECHQIMDEYQSIIFDDRSAHPQIHRDSEDDLADAALYAWRVSRHYAFQAPQEQIERHSEEHVEAWWDEQAERLERADDSDNFVIRDWNGEFGEYTW